MHTRSQDHRGEDDATRIQTPPALEIPILADLAPDDENPPTPQFPRFAHDAVERGAPSTSTPNRGEMTFSQESVTALMTSLQRTQTEAFKEILREMRTTNTTVSHDGMPSTMARCRSTFSGTSSESVTAFIDSVDSYIDCVGVSDTNIIKGLSMLLVGQAATWWQGIKSEVSCWAKAKDNLISAFGDRRPPYKIYLDIFDNPQGNENTDIFVSKLRALFAKLPKHDITENARLDITYGLLNTRIRKRIRREDFTSFNILLNLARSVEDSIGEEKNSVRNEISLKPPQPPLPPAATRAAAGAMYPTASRAQCPIASRAQCPTASRGLPYAPRSAEVQSAAPPPFHAYPPPTVTSLPRATEPPAFTVAGAAVEKKQRPQCQYCKRYGHTKEQCRKLANQGEYHSSNTIVESDNNKKMGESFYSVELSRSRKCSVTSNINLNAKDSMQHNGNNSTCFPMSTMPMNDACKFSSDNLDPRDLLIQNKTDCPREILNSNTACSTHGNCLCMRHWLPHKNACALSVNFENNVSPSSAQIDPLKAKERNCENCIFSKRDKNFFEENVLNMSINNQCYYDCICSENILSPGCGHEKYLTRREIRPIFKIEILGVTGTALIDTAAKHCIAGHTLYALLLRKGHLLTPSSRQIKLADGHIREMEVLTTLLEVSLERKMITIPFLIFPDSDNNETLLGIDFITAAGVVIDFREEVWCFSQTKNIQHKLLFEPTSREISCSSVHILRDDEGTHLNPAERNALAEVLVKHVQVFEAGGGPTPYAEHRIETGNHPPIAVPPYRLNPTKKELMKQEIDKMLDDDVIEECESAWCSPALMVPKPDGSIRFCVDYRRVNAITKSDAYPMPRIDELLQSTKRNCFMSSLDLRSSYWQVSVQESDRDKTAFVCPLGTYRFKKMPFGLKNAPATFQRLIDRLRSCAALKDVTVLAYLDDLLVISEGFHQHLQDLDMVLNRLKEFNLHVNRKKCAFARENVRYLGHVITQEGISADPQKISAVLEMKEPTNLKHLRTFLQTCSWFRKFIPNFSKVAEPLTRLTRKSQVWIWGPEQSQAFNDLKQLLTSAPVLVQPDFNSPFILRTDASNYALGAVLLQGEGNHQERPIEYASRLLNNAERNYSTTEREALAVVWAVERFRAYLDGQPVVIGSDHQPLRWLLSLKSPTGRLVRWALKLQSFDIKFEYTPGKSNVIADTLSRPICSSETRDSCGICSIICDLPAKSTDQLRQEQLSDPEVMKIVKELEGTDEVASRRWNERGYLINRGVLYRHNPDSESESPQLVIPADQVISILKELHDSSLAGHPGIDRTYYKVAQLYYFTGMRRIITDYVKACIHCQRYKASNAKPSGLLQTPVMNQRNEVLAIDLFGPLPEGDQGERWILLVEDTATRWTELYALKDATADACARILMEEYFMRFGLPRRVISDNGVQFVSAVMRQCMSVLGIKQSLVPLYHPEANPAERKNRDLKQMLAQLVEEDHTSWPTKLSLIRFALNGAKCRTTGITPAYLTFAREMRSPTEVTHDIRAILDKNNFVPQITPYLRKFIDSLSAIRERVEIQQDKTKEYADQSRRPAENFQVGNLVLLKSHVLSSALKNITAKFAPRRDGPYKIVEKVSPTTYTLSHVSQPSEILGKYHIQDLTPYKFRDDTSPPRPVIPKRKRGRPAVEGKILVQDPETTNRVLVPERGRSPGLEGEYIVNQTPKLPSRTSRGRMPARFLD